MKKLMPICLFHWFFILPLAAQQTDYTTGEALAVFFEEIRSATAQHQNLWDLDLYGPILLVDPATRRIYANYHDSLGLLEREHQLYTGLLPENINIANTSLHWNGLEWAMIMLPLPEEKHQRISLLAHELFHRAQSWLGFAQSNPNNPHLDEAEGRIYLRLELQALQQALQEEDSAVRKRHIYHALLFRQGRHVLYPAAAVSENQLELNEGLAEYTGIILSGAEKATLLSHFRESHQDFLSNPSFVRSFAYQTIPAYGYLLYQLDPDWQKRVKPDTDLTTFFKQAFNIQLQRNELTKHVKDKYQGSSILAEEKQREEERKALIEDYRMRLIESPHLSIPFVKMQISFDPRGVIPLGDEGSVYPVIRVVDEWGVLEVKKGALLSAGWDKITVSSPTSHSAEQISGDGWVLKLNHGWQLQLQGESSHYSIGREP